MGDFHENTFDGVMQTNWLDWIWESDGEEWRDELEFYLKEEQRNRVVAQG